MDNHYHLMIETPDANITIGMRQLNGVYAQQYNRKHDKPGYLFQGRYKAILVQKESYLLELCRYVVLNPVRAGMVKAPEKWEWSSYRAIAGLAKIPEYLTVDWIYSFFNTSKALAQERYRAFIREGMGQGSLWDKLQGQVLLGEKEFVESFKEAITEKEQVKEIPRFQRHVNRPGLNEIFEDGETKTQRNRKIASAHIKHGYMLKEIADHLKIHYSTVSKVLKQGLVKK